MRLPDVNVLIYAHREDAPEHDRYALWLKDLVAGPEPFALSDLVLSSFLRLVTNRRIFAPATPMDIALEFCHRLIRWPTSIIVRPRSEHWPIFVDLIRSAGIQGAMVTDAYLAAVAIEHGCEFITTDSDFARFKGLRWRHPLAAA
jgi:toxin-antitoxin system PIN domain toxin